MFSALMVSGGRRSSGCELGDGRRGTPYLEFGEVRCPSPKGASMPLLRLWFSQPQGRQASGWARTLGKGDIALEVSATGILEEEWGSSGGVLSPQKSQTSSGAWLGSGQHPLHQQVGPAHLSPQTSLVRAALALSHSSHFQGGH